MPRRLTVVALVVALATGLTGPAVAVEGDDPRAARDEVRREQAALATDLDVLEASEVELEAAAEALAAEVAAKTSDVEASRQAVDAATAEIDRAEAALAAARTEIDGLTAQLVDRAVNSFIVPERSSLYDVAVSADFGEAARKQAFIAQVVADEADLVDQLASARQDIEVEREAARVAEARAAQRRAETERQLGDLEVAAAEQARIQDAVEERQADVTAEIEALSANEAALTALIEQREQEQRDREARELAEAEQARAVERDRVAAQAAQADAARRVQADAARRVQADAARRVQEREQAPALRAAPTTRPAPAPGPAPTRSAPAPAPAPAPAETRTGGGGCIWPTRGTVTSEYGNRWGRLHAGIDVSAPIGTPIYAARSGTVLVAGTQSGYGTTIVLDHGDMTTLYAHQSRLAVGQGESVSQGELIGYVGNTGRSTGPHLHFETRTGGSPKNPRSCLS